MRSKNFDGSKPLLYLISTPIGNLKELNDRAKEIISDADYIACEDTRVTGSLLAHFGIKKQLISLREHNETTASNKVVSLIKDNKKVCYVSDAGYPLISDPGERLVNILLDNDINVSVVNGANAMLCALVASGLNASRFYFHGFLDPKSNARKEELTRLSDRPETLIFYESPHRVMKTLSDMYLILGNRKCSIARELTKLHEEYIRTTLEEALVIDESTLIGEMVIVVEGKLADDEIKLSNDEIFTMVSSYISKGLSTKEAIKEVAKQTKISKNNIYNLYHKN